MRLLPQLIPGLLKAERKHSLNKLALFCGNCVIQTNDAARRRRLLFLMEVEELPRESANWSRKICG